MERFRDMRDAQKRVTTISLADETNKRRRKVLSKE